MVKFNSKRLLAVIVATTMVLGSSLTALASAPEPKTLDGTGSYEGNLPTFDAPSVTLPTVPAGIYTYIGDPNGLIQKTASAHYKDYTWEGNGVYFLTDSDAKKYTASSKAYEITNNSAASLDVTVTLEQKTGSTKKNVDYSTDSEFKDKTDKLIYLAITDGTQTSAIAQKDAGDAVANTTPAKLNITLKGKPSNYEVKGTETGVYSVAAIDGEDDWNKASVTVTGALNLKANWESGAESSATEIVFPQVTVTYGLTYGATPVFIRDGVEQNIALSHKGAGVTISKIAFGTTAVPTNMYEATAIDGSKAATLTLKSGFTAYAYPKTPDDGLVFTVTYSDDFQETFTVVKW